jgi:hypothetical protein
MGKFKANNKDGSQSGKTAKFVASFESFLELCRSFLPALSLLGGISTAFPENPYYGGVLPLLKP